MTADILDFAAETVERRPAWYALDLSKPCWEWPGRLDDDGYGRLDGRTAHRVIWERILRRKLPDGIHLDHVCQNKRCVNPAHMEPVTPKENQRRSRVIRGLKPKSAREPKPRPRRLVLGGVCSHGHVLTEALLAIRTDGLGRCRECCRISERARWPQKKQRRNERARAKASLTPASVVAKPPTPPRVARPAPEAGLPQ